MSSGKRVGFGEAKVKVGGQTIDQSNIASVEVLMDLDNPDIAEVVLSNFGDSKGGGGGGDEGGDFVGSGVKSSRFSATWKEGDPMEVQLGTESNPPKTVFKGFVTSFTPSFDTHMPVTVNLMGMNALHKMTRKRNTRTFVNQTEQQIVAKVIQDNGLSPNFGKEPPTLMHEHLHQNNQTDLEFLKLRAARTNRVIYCEDKTVYFTKRNLEQGPIAKLTYTEEGVGSPKGGSLESFSPQRDTSAQLKTVNVHVWDPKTKKKLIGTAKSSPSPLGAKGGGGAAGDDPNLDVFDVPARSMEEAKLAAESILTERNMEFITGDATTLGNADVKLDKVVEIDAEDDQFDGKYYVRGVTHSFSYGSSGLGGGQAMGGFSTTVRFQRDAGNK